MVITSCDVCNKITTSRKYYILCKKCISCSVLYPKDRVKREFYLSDKDISNIRYVPLKTSKRFFLKDINQYILSNFGSYKNYHEYIKRKKDLLEKIKTTKEKNIAERKEKLIDALNQNKLIFRNYGYCYSYVNYGKPDINIVIKKELEKEQEKTKRKLRLSGELSKLDIRLDESLESCYNYINDIGDRDMKNTVRAIEIEHFLKYKTDYDNIRKIYDEPTARQIAVSRYYKKKNKICNDCK